MLTALYGAFGAAWVIWNHTTLPIPVPASWVIPIWPPEITGLTCVVLAWLVLGVITAWLPRQKLLSHPKRQTA